MGNITKVNGRYRLNMTEAERIAKGAEDEARTIPDFVTWSPDEAQQWVQNNVNDLATAKTVLVKMAGMIAAINARVFPNIRAGE